jgi:hypothetical protein
LIRTSVSSYPDRGGPFVLAAEGGAVGRVVDIVIATISLETSRRWMARDHALQVQQRRLRRRHPATVFSHVRWRSVHARPSSNWTPSRISIFDNRCRARIDPGAVSPGRERIAQRLFFGAGRGPGPCRQRSRTGCSASRRSFLTLSPSRRIFDGAATTHSIRASRLRASVYQSDRLVGG